MDWPSVLFGTFLTTLLAIPVGIVVIFLHRRVENYLDSRTVVKNERRKETAIRELKQVASYKRGEEDVYLAAITSVGLSIIAFVIGCTIFIGVAVYAPLSEVLSPAEDSDISISRIVNQIIVLLSLLVGCVFLLVGTMQLDQLIRTTKIYNNLDKHKKAVEDQFIITVELD